LKAGNVKKEKNWQIGPEEKMSFLSENQGFPVDLSELSQDKALA
jgi:hypothetical protein